MQVAIEKVFRKKFTLKNCVKVVLFSPLSYQSALSIQLHFFYNFFYTIFDLPTQKWGSKN